MHNKPEKKLNGKISEENKKKMILDLVNKFENTQLFKNTKKEIQKYAKIVIKFKKRTEAIGDCMLNEYFTTNHISEGKMEQYSEKMHEHDKETKDAIIKCTSICHDFESKMEKEMLDYIEMLKASSKKEDMVELFIIENEFESILNILIDNLYYNN